ncbi:MAG: GIY-YIG nuclease family protein [Gammaproteobacteria bacterium]|nr:GIY-YIG nuclease family protein [Gammaproteobacteria bacterium]CAJ2376999.1 MAG: putative DNA damage response nuclease YhbQ [Arenicellales bacterium IbO2]MDA7961606.1 GIY-YIG nuclease family protein [Gammaproteobacteria bacterium]MDA7970029.1 GIY-YIG nuclease family protein [Gammaproteobacteria bacterium]MDA7971327.1 GIY-YIG nuclease family protein [Gammaproteobacteria bacterium]
MSDWFVYMLRCADASLYTGITTDLARRLTEHNAGAAGARYTRARRPVTLVYQERLPNRSAAAKREQALRRLGKAEKERLAAG